MHAHEQPVVRPYLRVERIDESLLKAEGLGAEIALGVTELPGHGLIAIYMFGGIQQGIWQVS